MRSHQGNANENYNERHFHIPWDGQNQKDKQVTDGISKEVEEVASPTLLVGMSNGAAAWGSSLAILQKLRVTYAAIPLLDIDLRETNTYVHGKWKQMLVAALSINSEKVDGTQMSIR